MIDQMERLAAAVRMRQKWLGKLRPTFTVFEVR